MRRGLILVLGMVMVRGRVNGGMEMGRVGMVVVKVVVAVVAGRGMGMEGVEMVEMVEVEVAEGARGGSRRCDVSVYIVVVSIWVYGYMLVRHGFFVFPLLSPCVFVVWCGGGEKMATGIACVEHIRQEGCHRRA